MSGAHSESQTSPYRVQVLDRVFRILDLLAEPSSKNTLPEIAEALQLHKSTAHRLLTVLERERFVERNTSGKYRIGSRVIEMGLSALSQLDLYEVAKPYLRTLVDQTGETAHLAVLRDGQAVSLLNVDSRQTLRTPGAVGDRRPVHCTATGKAMLAGSSLDELNALLKGYRFQSFTRNTIATCSRLRIELQTIRERGYSVDNEEWEVGLRCIGAPVRDSAGSTVAAISISGPVFRITPDRLDGLSQMVRRAAGEISYVLGYRNRPSAQTGT